MFSNDLAQLFAASVKIPLKMGTGRLDKLFFLSY